MQEKEARMKIQATGRRTVSIRLSGEELSGYGLTFVELEPGNRRMEQMMGELLSRVYEETGMDLFNHTLRMKAVPMETGCELTLSGLMARRGRLQNAGPAAVDFLEWESLCRGAEALLSQGAFRKSSVFQMRNGWRLLLWGEDGNQAVPDATQDGASFFKRRPWNSEKRSAAGMRWNGWLRVSSAERKSQRPDPARQIHRNRLPAYPRRL